MGFGFTRRTDVQAQIRRIAAEQAHKAVAACGGHADFDKTVHGLRRRCKKLRGLLRLIEPRFKGFEAENRAIRDAAQGLSGSRDATVMVETFEALLQFDRSGDRVARIGAPPAAVVSAWLKGRIAAVPSEGRVQLLGTFCSAMEQVGARARGWTIGGRNFAALEGGLALTCQRLADDMAIAMKAETAEALHDWRKQVKYHWHHVSLLQRAAPELLASPRDLLEQLGELLGDHHNLHVLDELLVAEGGSIEADLGTIRPVIGQRQVILATRAFSLGRQLTAEKPAALRRRFKNYWQLLPDED